MRGHSIRRRSCMAMQRNTVCSVADGARGERCGSMMQHAVALSVGVATVVHATSSPFGIRFVQG